MRLTDLCNGDIIQFRNGRYAVYSRNYLYGFIIPSSRTPYSRIEGNVNTDYMPNLSHKRLISFDIVKIYRPTTYNIELLWAGEGKAENVLIEEIGFFELYRIGQNQYNLYDRGSDEIKSSVSFDENNQIKIKGDIGVSWLEKIIKDRKEIEYSLSLKKSLGICKGEDNEKANT